MSKQRTYSIDDLALRLASVSSTPLRDIRYFVSELTGSSIAELFGHVVLSDRQYQQLESMIGRRLRREPVAYILGHTEFWGLRLHVHPEVLIPRPDTEILVETVLGQLHDADCRCLDLGTGSGAITLALASERPEWLFDAVDQSPGAVECARQNAAHLALGSGRLQFHCADWTMLPAEIRANAYDLIVANPPYIDTASEHISEETKRFEPHRALYAPDLGLRDLFSLIDLARSLLRPSGLLYLEHGYDQAAAVRSCFTRMAYSAVTTVQDYAGHDRVTYAQWQGSIDRL